MASPKEIPERNDIVLKCLKYTRASKANNIEVSTNGNIMESKTTLLVNQVDGVTAKSNEANKPTVGLNLRSPILYIKKVSTIAMIPIINLGTANSPSIDTEPEIVLRLCGKLMILNIAAKNICPKNGWSYELVEDCGWSNLLSGSRGPRPLSVCKALLM
jgi:hypothetical protein